MLLRVTFHSKILKFKPPCYTVSIGNLILRALASQVTTFQNTLIKISFNLSKSKAPQPMLDKNFSEWNIKCIVQSNL